MKTTEPSIRLSMPDDLEVLQRLFVECILSVCAGDYSEDQLRVWSASVKNIQRWTEMLSEQYALVAERHKTIVGFASLAHKGYVDFIYVHKDFQRQGIAERLYADIEKAARRRQAVELHSDVSKTARPFFERMGFRAIKEQTLTIEGIEISNYLMIKVL